MRDLHIRTVQEVLVDTLRQSILVGEVKPGDRLVQEEIAVRFGVSRIPVREALRTLAAEGLLTFHSRRGFMVTALTREDVEEIFSIRILLEGMATRLAAERITPVQLGNLRELLKRLEAARNDPGIYFDINYQFHSAIFDAAGRRRLKTLVMNLRNAVEPVARRYLAPVGRVEAAHGDHLAIFEALARHDSSAAERLARDHMLHVLDGLLADWKDLASRE